MELGAFGVWTSQRALGDDTPADAARLVEELGYGTFWLGGSPRLTDTEPLLAATERLTVATGIVNVWQYEPAQLAAEHAQLRAAYPDRLLMGIGIGHREATQEYSQPLAKMGAFFDGLDAADPAVPKDERATAALRPGMLALAAERSRGAHTYFVPVEHTSFAREQVGPGELVATELACVVDTDRERARASARHYAQLYLNLQNYTRNLLHFGFTEADIANGGSDRLIDAVIPHGSAEQVATVAHEHLEAGANHVCLQPVGPHGMPREAWTALASALGLS
jgi:probable F420-dependent oxidoreductase